MQIARTCCAALALSLSLFATAADAAGAVGAQALRSRHLTLQPQLASNAFGGPLVLESQEEARRIEGEVYAVLDHPFAGVSAALADPGQWCDILILHLNTKYCRRAGEGAATRMEVRVGKKEEQAVDKASLLAFDWRPPTQRADYLLAEMEARDGPYDTRDYRLLVEAVPIGNGRTFLHMTYALSYGTASHLAMHVYLGTAARDKVGFTRAEPGGNGGEPVYVGGMRGVVERNTMRYYLAIDSYLASLQAPAARQLEQRLQAWFDATERYPRQLHEVEREAYLRMKRNEVQRQRAPRGGS